jgi:murein L,D-transpeptidase YafK
MHRRLRLTAPLSCLTLVLVMLLAPSYAKTARANAHTNTLIAPAATEDGMAEARLLEVYRLAANGRSREALALAGKVVHDHPNFQLAQLVYGDLLASRVRPVHTLGDVPSELATDGASALAELREESQKRVQSLRDPPRRGTIPWQFLEIPQRTRHAIAVDASHSRLYLFENRPTGLTLIGDYYTSIGKAGVSKTAQGDQRTPLGVYFITSNINPRSLKDFYGSGALPINYPNMLNAKRGKTGSGIWLHGTQPQQFSRPPQASDGCLVMANPDLKHIIQTVEVGSTPVVIAPTLNWVDPHSAKVESKPFDETLQAWRTAKVMGNLDRVMSFYTQDFNSYGKTLEQWSGVLREELARTQGHDIELKDISLLRWTDTADTMVVTFGEVLLGKRTGWTKRQYWIRQSGQWKIFFEGTL